MAEGTRRAVPALLRQSAIEYAEQGRSVLPLCDPDHRMKPEGSHKHPPDKCGKIPLLAGWKRWMTERAPVSLVREWWTRWPEANVGIVLGAVSGMVGWDVEDEPARAALEGMHGGPLPPTPSFLTGNGTRYLFAWPEDWPIPKAQFDTPLSTLVFLADHSYTVAPPSRHLTGPDYRWVAGAGLSELELPTLPLPLLRAVEAHKKGWRREKTRCGGAIPSPDKTDYWYRRAEGWAKGAPGAKKGKRGRRSYALACALVVGFHQPPEVAARLMAEHWAPRNDPPTYTEAEILTDCQRAAREGRFDTPPDTLHRTNGTPRGRGVPHLTAPGRQPRPGDPPPAPVAPLPVPPPADPPGYEPGNSVKQYGRRASEFQETALAWLYEPWVALGTLTMVAGRPGTGKSTLGAYLMSRAERVILLPGREESFTNKTLPRLRAHGVNLNNVLVLSENDWTFPPHKNRLATIVAQERARLVWIDPIDSYKGDITGNHEVEVRPLLESLAWVAETCECAVCAVKHPGKTPGNLLPGSVQWAAVPRAVLELILDKGPPLRRIIRPDKDSHGREAPPHYYDLVGEKGEPKIWTWQEEAGEMAVDTARSVQDRVDRWKITQAKRFLEGFLADGEMPCDKIYLAGIKEGLNDRTIRRAAELIPVYDEGRGQGGEYRTWWSLKEFPPR